jgi:hypothetical protein
MKQLPLIERIKLDLKKQPKKLKSGIFSARLDNDY